MLTDLNPQIAAQVVLLAREGPMAEAELHAFLRAQNVDVLTALVATMWVGRGSFDAEDWADARAFAEAEASTPTDDYLMGSPHLAENLEAGLEAMGISVSEVEDAVMGR